MVAHYLVSEVELLQLSPLLLGAAQAGLTRFPVVHAAVVQGGQQGLVGHPGCPGVLGQHGVVALVVLVCFIYGYLSLCPSTNMSAKMVVVE